MAGSVAISRQLQPMRRTNKKGSSTCVGVVGFVGWVCRALASATTKNMRRTNKKRVLQLRRCRWLCRLGLSRFRVGFNQRNKENQQKKGAPVASVSSSSSAGSVAISRRLQQKKSGEPTKKGSASCVGVVGFLGWVCRALASATTKNKEENQQKKSPPVASVSSAGSVALSRRLQPKKEENQQKKGPPVASLSSALSAGSVTISRRLQPKK